MALTISGLSNYTQKATEIFVQEYLYSPARENYAIQKGVVYKQHLNFGTASVTLQGSGCDLTPTGGATFTEKDVETVPIQTLSSYCFSEVRTKGTTIGEIQRAIVSEVTKDIMKQTDTLLWAGKTASGDLMNGHVYYMASATSLSDAAVLSTTNIDDKIALLVASALANENMVARGVLTLEMPLAYYNMYKVNRLQANYYHDSAAIGMNESWLFGYEGQIKIKGIAGMGNPATTGIDDIWLTWEKNHVIALDEVSEGGTTYMKILVDEEKDLVYVKTYTKLGAQLKYNNEAITLR